jgi:hypothetical protein
LSDGGSRLGAVSDALTTLPVNMLSVDAHSPSTSFPETCSPRSGQRVAASADVTTVCVSCGSLASEPWGCSHVLFRVNGGAEARANFSTGSVAATLSLGPFNTSMNVTVQVRSVDTAGNVGAASTLSWIVDAGMPQALLLSTPSRVSRDGAATFSVGCSLGAPSACRYEYQLDAGPRLSFSGGGGASSCDTAVASSGASPTTACAFPQQCDTDTTPPVVGFLVAPPQNDVTPRGDARFIVRSSEAETRFEYRYGAVNGSGLGESDVAWSAWFVAPSALIVLSGLHSGVHRAIAVRGTDVAGNTGNATEWRWLSGECPTALPARIITVETVPVSPGVKALTWSTDVGSGVGGDGVEVQYRVDDGAWVRTSATHVLLDSLSLLQLHSASVRVHVVV